MSLISTGFGDAPTTAFTTMDVAAAPTRTAVSGAATTPSPAIDFTVIRDQSAFDALEREWSALFARCGSAHQLFQTFAWNWHWTRAFLDPDRASGANCPIAVLTGRQNGRLVTLWPMVIERRGALRELSWMGEPVSQYGDILVDDGIADRTALLAAGWAFLIKALKPDLARLRKVRGDSAIAPLLDTLGSLHTAELEAPFIDLTKSPSFAAYEERFPTRARRNRRRQMRRLEEAGTVTFKHLDQGAEASGYAADGIEMKRRWLIDRGHVSPALADARMARFMTAVATANEHATATRVSVLLSNGKPAAIQIGFTARNARVLHVIAYDRAYEKMAAGVLHLEESIRHAFDEKLDRIDLLAPKAEYKVDWADGTVGVVDHAIGLSVKGRVYARVYLGYVRERLKAAVERMPHKLRQMLVTSHLNAVAKRLVGILGMG
ncbi:MAG: GNAT family N-acetyltransferase [Hyphomicrobiaceae bacterium]